MGRYANRGNKSQRHGGDIRGEISKAAKEGRPGFVANLFGGALNAGIAMVGAVAGYKAAGPVGVGGGILAGAAVVETAKHYVGAAATAVMNRGGSSGGAGVTVDDLRAAVNAVADELVSSTSGPVMSAIQIIEESLTRIQVLSPDSSAYAVSEAIGHLSTALTVSGEVNSLYGSAAESARNWAAGI